MKDLCTALGLGGRLLEENLNEILFAAKLNDLPIYFNNDMYGAKISDGVELIINEKGEVINAMVSGKGIYTSGARNIYLSGYSFDNTIVISSYLHDSNDYYPIDETGMWQTSQNINAHCFFCNKNELFSSGLLKDSSSANQSNKISKQQQRETACKQWLASKAGIAIENDFKYQECYQLIGEPTQKHIWNELTKMDIHLFSVDRGEFFKHQKIIRFKIGTSKGRSVK